MNCRRQFSKQWMCSHSRALRWSTQHMNTKKASTKLASIFLILDEITAIQPTAGQSRTLRWLVQQALLHLACLILR